MLFLLQSRLGHHLLQRTAAPGDPHHYLCRLDQQQMQLWRRNVPRAHRLLLRHPARRPRRAFLVVDHVHHDHADIGAHKLCSGRAPSVAQRTVPCCFQHQPVGFGQKHGVDIERLGVDMERSGVDFERAGVDFERPGVILKGLEWILKGLEWISKGLEWILKGLEWILNSRPGVDLERPGVDLERARMDSDRA